MAYESMNLDDYRAELEAMGADEDDILAALENLETGP
jgi:hypothetical protein